MQLWEHNNQGKSRIIGTSVSFVMKYFKHYTEWEVNPILNPILNTNIELNIEPIIGPNIEPDIETQYLTQY